jgi:hypothetical protein
MDIEVSAWFSSKMDIESDLHTQEIILWGHQGHFFILKTITWDKADINVITWSARPFLGPSRSFNQAW